MLDFAWLHFFSNDVRVQFLDNRLTERQSQVKVDGLLLDFCLGDRHLLLELLIFFDTAAKGVLRSAQASFGKLDRNVVVLFTLLVVVELLLVDGGRGGAARLLEQHHQLRQALLFLVAALLDEFRARVKRDCTWLAAATGPAFPTGLPLALPVPRWKRA